MNSAEEVLALFSGEARGRGASGREGYNEG